MSDPIKCPGCGFPRLQRVPCRVCALFAKGAGMT